MNNTFYIGFDKEKIGIWCSTICWPNANVSANELGYHVRNEAFICDFYISRKSEVGKALEQIVKSKCNNLLEEFSNNLAMEYLNYKDIFILLEEATAHGFENGYRSAQKDIGKALGLREW